MDGLLKYVFTSEEYALIDCHGGLWKAYLYFYDHVYGKDKHPMRR